jgi:hypothetical protein
MPRTLAGGARATISSCRHPDDTIVPARRKKILGAGNAFCILSPVPMTVQHNHLRGYAGASFTKAVVGICRAQMRPVVLNWNKRQTGSGFQA